MIHFSKNFRLILAPNSTFQTFPKTFVWILAQSELDWRWYLPYPDHPVFSFDGSEFKNVILLIITQKNNTNDGYYSINSGTTDINKLGEIVSWENSSTLEIWGENGTCNDIVGSDSTIFPPFATEDSVLNIFSTDICRYESIIDQLFNLRIFWLTYKKQWKNVCTTDQWAYSFLKPQNMPESIRTNTLLANGRWIRRQIIQTTSVSVWTKPRG